MGKKKNNSIKLGVFLFGLSLFLWNCQDEEVYQQQNGTQINEFTLEKLNFTELKNDIEIQRVLPILEKRIRNNSTYQEKQEEVAEGLFINTSQIHKITQGETISWTFKVDNPVLQASNLENFLVKKHNNVFSYFLVSYQSNETENKYQQAYLYKIPKEYLNTDNLNLSSKDSFDWAPIESGGGDSPCEGIRYYESCNMGGSADGHGPALQLDGVSYCEGSPYIIDFSHCNSGTYNPPEGPSNSLGNPNDDQIGGGGADPAGTGTTTTSPVDIQDINCPPFSGKIFVNGDCICPIGFREDPVTGNCIEDDCNTSSEDLKKIFPNASESTRSTLASIINEKGRDFGINTKEKLQHFLAQAGHETGGFKNLNVRESLYYTTASLIPKRYDKFTMDTIANPKKLYAGDYINDEEKLANAAMSDRFENEDEASGDGWKYRGRGILQLTWKENYRRFEEWYNGKYNANKNFRTNPDLISNNDTLAIMSGLWYFKYRVLDRIPDFEKKATIVKVTWRINPPLEGIEKRESLMEEAKKSIKCK